MPEGRALTVEVDQAVVHVPGARRAEEVERPHPRLARAGDVAPGPLEVFGGDLTVAIADLKARDDEGTILVHGGPDFAQSLTRLGLVDEYQLSMVPIAIGAGRSPFAKLDEHLKLDIVEEERFRSGALAQILVPRR